MPDDPMYHEGMRRLQDMRETRLLADRLEQVTVRTAFTGEDRAFIERCPMFFMATADADGHPDCAYRGGLPGFVRVLDGCTLAIPDYDGNGMYRSWGNVLVNPHIGLLFLDFENPKRIRVNGTAKISESDPLRAEYPGSVFIIRVTARRIFPNCPRYIHKMQLVEHSVSCRGQGTHRQFPRGRPLMFFAIRCRLATIRTARRSEVTGMPANNTSVAEATFGERA